MRTIPFRSNGLCLVAALALAGLLLPVRVDAQATGSSRPFRGLFGGSNANGTDGGLDATISFAESYDGDVTGQGSRGAADPARTGDAISGYFSVAAVDLGYARRTTRFSVAANGRTLARYYPDNDVFGTTQNGALALTATLGSVRLALTQSAEYNPFYSFAVEPQVVLGDSAFASDSPVPAANPRVNILRRTSISYQTGAHVEKQLTTRTSLGGSVGWRKTNFTTGTGDLTESSGTIRLSRHFSRYLSLSGGYGYQSGLYEDEKGILRRRPAHSIIIGTDYDRPLSRTRRTTMSLSTGTSAVTTATGERVFRVVGRGGLNHQFGRTWLARAEYERAVRYVEAFADPLFADATDVTFDGFLSRRIDLNARVGASRGTVGMSVGAPEFTSYSVSTQLRVAVNRSTALYGQYTYYHYDFDVQTALPGIPRQFDRNAATLGVSVWLPLAGGRERRR